MAKGTIGDSPFRKTEGEASTGNSDLDHGNVRSLGVGLREGEIQAIERLAAGLGVSRNAVAAFLMNWAIVEARAGNINFDRFIETPPTPAKRLKRRTDS